jgi:hypothetical protein
MKISEIQKKDASIYVVKFKPNWIESLFGLKEKQEEFKCTNETYVLGGRHAYLRKNGEYVGNGHSVQIAIDKWRKSW